MIGSSFLNDNYCIFHICNYDVFSKNIVNVRSEKNFRDKYKGANKIKRDEFRIQISNNILIYRLITLKLSHFVIQFFIVQRIAVLFHVWIILNHVRERKYYEIMFIFIYRINLFIESMQLHSITISHAFFQMFFLDYYSIRTNIDSKVAMKEIHWNIWIMYYSLDVINDLSFLFFTYKIYIA